MRRPIFMTSSKNKELYRMTGNINREQKGLGWQGDASYLCC